MRDRIDKVMKRIGMAIRIVTVGGQLLLDILSALKFEIKLHCNFVRWPILPICRNRVPCLKASCSVTTNFNVETFRNFITINSESSIVKPISLER